MHYKVYFEEATVDTEFTYPTIYQCSTGAIKDENDNYCVDFDLCSKNPEEPTQLDYDGGRCCNYPWCENNYKFDCTEDPCSEFDSCAAGGDGD